MQLPPNIQQLSTHKFGTFSLEVTSINSNYKASQYNLQDQALLNIFTVCPVFLGMPYTNIDKFQYPTSQIVTFPIMTPAWYFYLYLTDMQTLVFKFNKINKKQNQSSYTSKINLKLEDACQILRKEFCGQTPILKTNKYECQLRDDQENLKGSVKIQLKISFDVSLHKLIKNLMNFKDILVIEGISRIGAQQDDQVLQSPRPPPSISSLSEKFTQNISKQASQPIKKQQIRQTQLYLQKQSPQQDDQKVVNDDIDRMIAQLQHKTYDSSRYQQNTDVNTKNTQFLPSKTVFIQKNIPSLYPPLNRTNSMMLPPHKRPQSYQKQYEHHNNHFILQKEQPNHIRSQSTGKNSNISPNNWHNTNIKLKINEVFISGCSQQDKDINKYQLSMYAMDNCKTQDKIFCLRKQKQGDVINFDHSTVMSPIVSSNKLLKCLKFQLQQSPDIEYGQIYETKNKKLEGFFDISRLHSMPNKKGVFMVSFTYPQRQAKISISKLNTKLNELPSIPKHYSLRIQLEVDQPPVEQCIIQIFSKISRIQLYQNYKLDIVKYKIPYTKDQIEFNTKENSHWNIFPHTREYEQIILEFWNEGRLLGISLIDLKMIKNTNAYAITASQQPIWLYNKDIKIMNIVDNNKIYGKFHLQLCFGTVRQMQKVLKGQLSSDKNQGLQQKQVEIRLDEKSGIYIKQKKQNVSTQVQVDFDIQKKAEDNNIYKQMKQSLRQQQQFIDKQQDKKTNFQNSSRHKYSQQQQFQSGEQQQEHENNIDEYEDVIRHCKQKSVKKPEQIAPKSITESLQKRMTKQLEKLSNTNIINKLKSQLRPHTLYNFIDINKLREILQNLDIKKVIVRQIIQQILLPCNDMVNVNILYDYLASLSINNTIKPTLIPAHVLGKYCLRLLYQRASQNISPVTSEYQFNELRQIMLKTPIKSQFYDRSAKKLNFKLTMHQYNSVIAYIQAMAKQRKQTPEQIKQHIEALISREKMIMEMQKDQEEQVERALYGQLDASQYSQNKNEFLQANQSQATLTNIYQSKVTQRSLNSHYNIKEQAKIEKQQQMKQTTWNLKKNEENRYAQEQHQNKLQYFFKISGLQTCKNSAKSLLDRQFPDAIIKVKVLQPFQQVFIFRKDKEQQFQAFTEIEQLFGTVWLENAGEQIAICNFNIIEDINSVYVLKHNNQFCGLVNISFNKQKI